MFWEIAQQVWKQLIWNISWKDSKVNQKSAGENIFFKHLHDSVDNRFTNAR